MNGFLTSIVYQANIAWVRAVLLVVADRTIKGVRNVPRKGPLIVVANHLNNADPPLLAAAIPREIAWLTKAEWFETPVIGGLFRMGGMIPVRRFNADLQALRKAQDLLKRGGVLGMFPEGTRSHGEGLQEGEPGTALIALRTGAPILPVGIWGTENVKLPRDLFRRGHADIRIGKPYTLPRPQRITRRDVLQGTETIMRSIAVLLPEKYRGVHSSAHSSALATSTDAG